MKAAALSLLALACAATRDVEREMPQPKHLPQTARDLLAERMLNHGSDMSDLLWATLFLDDQSVKDIAQNIRATPRFARPLTGDATELNSLLPAEFFELQDELVARADALEKSAVARDPEAMASAYGALAQKCVRCHSIYLSEPRVTAEPSVAREPVTAE